MQTLFSIHRLTLAPYGHTILDIAQLHIPQGVCTAIIGPNGAGKSTLLRALLGQSTPDCVRLHGQPVAPQLKQGKVAWVGQHGRYTLPLSVREYIRLGLYPRRRLADPEAEAQLLQQFDLLALAEKRIGMLSGGEQQRAAIVRALLQNAPVLLLDEPCNHLDIRHQHRLMAYLHRQRHMFTSVMVLHDLNLAAAYAENIILMNRGGVIGCGTAEAVLRSELLSSVYQWPVEVQHNRHGKVVNIGCHAPDLTADGREASSV